jgi:DNA (cytosine-5)-methyltransferase 1
LSKNYKAISLFSGALGLDIGLDRAGFSITVAIENNRYAVETIYANKDKLINSKNLQIIDRDIHLVSTDEILEKGKLKIGETTLITGGPACQTFSTAGSRESLGDPRGNLFLEFRRIIDEAKPRFFVMENVKGILSAAKKHRPLNKRGPGFPLILPEEELGSGFRYILSELQKTGYYIVFGLLNSADYGVPQKRERLIILGSRDGENIRLPFPTHSKEGLGLRRPWVTLRDGLCGLADYEPEHKPIPLKHQSYLELIPEGGNWHNLPIEFQEKAIGGAYKSWGGRGGFLRRLSWSQPSPALTTDPNGRATMLCHPTEMRTLSIKEYARLQQFPDDWIFKGSTSNKYLQIGNAVPVGLGEAIGLALFEIMDIGKTSKDRLGLVVCGTPEILDRMAQRPTTFLNPPEMREDPDNQSVEEWFGRKDRYRNSLVEYIKKLAIPAGFDEKLKKSHYVVELLQKEYGSPNYGNKVDPLDELVFIVLSLMTTHPSYSRVYDRLKQLYPKWSDLLNISVEELEETIMDLGLSKQKAPRIIEILNIINEKFKEVSLSSLQYMPDRQVEEFLISLPGIGMKAAKCIMMYSLNRKVLPVDTHINRVSRRLGLIPADLPMSRVHDEIEMVVQPTERYNYHVNVLAHGQSVCYAKHPHCEKCVIRDLCDYGITNK